MCSHVYVINISSVHDQLNFYSLTLTLHMSSSKERTSTTEELAALPPNLISHHESKKKSPKYNAEEVCCDETRPRTNHLLTPLHHV